MTALDLYLQNQRIKKASQWISPTDRVLDIGCGDGALLRGRPPHPLQHLGIDRSLAEPISATGFRIETCSWDQAQISPHSFDAIVLLAVWEHIPPNQQPLLCAKIKEWLKPGGKVILTIPHAWVDTILWFLQKARMVDGMHVEEHYGYAISDTRPCFERAGFQFLDHTPFQWHLNHLFVFSC
jgi:cyclopropane fatty-acyl-phospholipid synthase-like methyltransferase